MWDFCKRSVNKTISIYWNSVLIGNEIYPLHECQSKREKEWTVHRPNGPGIRKNTTYKNGTCDVVNGDDLANAFCSMRMCTRISGPRLETFCSPNEIRKWTFSIGDKCCLLLWLSLLLIYWDENRIKLCWVLWWTDIFKNIQHKWNGNGCITKNSIS